MTDEEVIDWVNETSSNRNRLILNRAMSEIVKHVNAIRGLVDESKKSAEYFSFQCRDILKLIAESASEIEEYAKTEMSKAIEEALED